MQEAITIIVIMTLATTLLLVGLPVIFPDMIPDNVKKHIQGSVPKAIISVKMPAMSDGH